MKTLISPTAFFCSIIHFIITLLTDGLVFLDPLYFTKLKYIVIKVLVFITLVFLWNYIFKVVKKVKEGDDIFKRRLKFFSIYFVTSLILLLLIWPGRWIWDEFFLYEEAINLRFVHWQHYLSSVYYLFCLMIIPFGAGVVLIQLIIISLIVAYIVTDLSYKSKYYYFLFIILLFPSIIAQNLYPIRATLYGYILVYVLYYMYFELRKRTKIELSQIVLLLFLLPLLGIWRAEGIIVFPFLLLLFYFIIRNKFSTINLVKYFGVIFCLFFLLNYNQKKWDDENKEYSITAFLNPLSMMLQFDDLNKLDVLEKDLSGLINLKILKENPDYRETPAFWNFRNELILSTKNEDYNRFKFAYFKLVINNPITFLKVRMKTFIATSTIVTGIGRSSGAAIIEKSNEPMIQGFLKNSYWNKSFNPYLRSDMIRVLEGNNIKQPEIPTLPFYLFWNLMIVYFVLTCTTVVAIFKKDYIFTYICFMIWVFSFGIFITAPASYFMYYFPIYLTICILSFSYLIQLKKAKGDEEFSVN